MSKGFLAKPGKTAPQCNENDQPEKNYNCFQAILVTKEQPGTKADPVGG